MHPDLVKSALSAAGINIDSARIFSLSKELESLACKYSSGFEVCGGGGGGGAGPSVRPWRSSLLSGLAEERKEPKTSAELAAAAVEAEIAERIAAEKEARVAQLQFQIDLAYATVSILNDINKLDGGESEVLPKCRYAEFRKELTPLAVAYGYKIVLVGDKSRATLSK